MEPPAKGNSQALEGVYRVNVPLGCLSRFAKQWRRRSGTSALTIVGLLGASLTGVVVTTVVASSSASAGTPPAAPPGFITTFSDNFSGPAGSAPNAANWFYDEGTGFGTGEIETMTNSTANCSLDGNGDLKLTASGSGTNWTSCRLESTRDDFFAPPGGQMIMEASVEQPGPASGNGLGYWPAFWPWVPPGVPAAAGRPRANWTLWRTSTA